MILLPFEYSPKSGQQSSLLFLFSDLALRLVNLIPIYLQPYSKGYMYFNRSSEAFTMSLFS